ncbi:MAG: RrF2 family transcriptional regulator [Candidatus Bipolaricaulota bacterium]|nr:MAG: RrF2 family transcriptional regulator [Candidatus Bipolaricaulota bacterium]
MIRVSTRGRYALRALVDVGLHADDGPVNRKKLADRQGISAEYVAQLFRDLIAAGLAVGVKGPGGGYCLAREPEVIRASDVLRAVEGPLALVHCVGESGEATCPRTNGCVTHRLWTRLSSTLQSELDAVTLADLVAEARELGNS